VTFTTCPVRRAISVIDNLPSSGLPRHSYISGTAIDVVFGSRCLWGLSRASPHVTIFTAASAPTRSIDPSNSQPSGWGVCVADDWLKTVVKPLPSKAESLKKVLKPALAFGDQINPFYPGGIYVSRLIALVHALLSVPVLCNLRVVCTQGAIDAMSWFRLATLDRHRLKLCGRPVLALLEEVLRVRCHHGGVTTFERFNKDGAALDVAGMTCAKFWADKGRSKLTHPATGMPQCSDDFVSCAISSKPVLANVRHGVRNQIKLDLLRRWSDSGSQAAFCSEATTEMMAALRVILVEGGLQQCHLQFALRAITDTVQFNLTEDDDGDGKRVFSSTPCKMCNMEADTDAYHLFACDHPDAIDARLELRDVILAEISHANGSSVWVNQQQEMPLMAVIGSLFSTQSNAQQLRLALGAFSQNELSGAMSTAAISDVELWPTVSRGLRVALISYAYQQWILRVK
jgi:hypothetical protein